MIVHAARHGSRIKASANSAAHFCSHLMRAAIRRLVFRCLCTVINRSPWWNTCLWSCACRRSHSESTSSLCGRCFSIQWTFTCVLVCSVTENVPKDHLPVHALMAVTLFVVNLARLVKKAGYIRASRNVSVALVRLRWVEAFSFAAVCVVVYVTETLEWRFQFYQLSECCVAYLLTMPLGWHLQSRAPPEDAVLELFPHRAKRCGRVLTALRTVLLLLDCGYGADSLDVYSAGGMKEYYIKAAQTLCGAGLFPEEFVEVFAVLVDQCPKEPFEVVKAIVEEQLGCPLAVVFTISTLRQSLQHPSGRCTSRRSRMRPERQSQ